MEKAIGFYSN